MLALRLACPSHTTQQALKLLTDGGRVCAAPASSRPRGTVEALSGDAGSPRASRVEGL